MVGVAVVRMTMSVIARMPVMLVPMIAVHARVLLVVVRMRVIVSVRPRFECVNATAQLTAGEKATLHQQRFERTQKMIVVMKRRRRTAATNDILGMTIERTDLSDQPVAKVVPRIDTLFRHTACDAEGPALPRRVEHEFAVQHRRRRSAVERELRRHRSTSTPIIESRVTRATSSSSVAAVASVGICGNTM